MTPRHVLELSVALEKDLADFYQEIGGIDRLRPFADIFSFMADHSARHAAQIEKAAAAFVWPVLNTEPINELQRRIKSSLLDQIRSETDENAVMSKLARTEDIIGQLYQSIAEHYRKLSESCSAVADQFEGLSREEYGHRDYILEK
jgi:rubrerythrin